MVMTQGDPVDSVKGWQGDAVDVEIERIYTRRGCRYRWELYDRDRRVRVGVRRSHWGARLAGIVSAVIYRACR